MGLVKAPRSKYRSIINALDFREAYAETFIGQQYKWLYDRIKPGTTLIDIGANIGDTTIYFSMNINVKRIEAYEPTLRLYEEAKRLLMRYPYKNRIKFVNMAITHDGGKVTTAYGDGNKTGSITLAMVLAGRKKVAIKCDIEGEERYLFKDVDLSEVYAIEIECHYDCDAEVLSILKAKGFGTGYLTDPNYGRCLVWAERLPTRSGPSDRQASKSRER